jgi:hypothetical protein
MAASFRVRRSGPNSSFLPHFGGYFLNRYTALDPFDTIIGNVHKLTTTTQKTLTVSARITILIVHP